MNSPFEFSVKDLERGIKENNVHAITATAAAVIQRLLVRNSSFVMYRKTKHKTLVAMDRIDAITFNQMIPAPEAIKKIMNITALKRIA